MYRGALTPRRTNLTFGDSDPSRPIEALLGYGQPYGAYRFSANAGRNAAWVVRDVLPRPLLSTYVLLDDSILAPQPPRSFVWADTAAFWEAGGSEDSLMGALWCPRTAGSHSHPDVNAVHLYAYGENVLRNSGYCGSDVGVDSTFDRDWIFDTTAANNTVTLAGAEHDQKFGAGVQQSLLAPRFDYAAARAGPALHDGEHVRSLLMLHGEPGLPGYFVLFDEVETAAAGTPVEVNLHPDSDVVATIAAGAEYEWTIRHFGPDDVQLSVFLATRPASAELLDGGLCAFDGNEYVGRYLRSTHFADALGRRNVVTLLVPHDARRAKPTLTRIPGTTRYSGALVSHPSGVHDFVLESDGTAPVAFGSTYFHGRAIHARLVGGMPRQYFVRQGRGYDDGGAQRRGFDSDAEVSLFVRGTAAYVTSAGATVVFHDPALTGHVYTTSAGTVLSAGPGFVEVELLPGKRAFDLATGAAP
jgi:hypothetical protein